MVLFIQQLNASNQCEKFKNFAISHGIYTFEVVWSVAFCKDVI